MPRLGKYHFFYARKKKSENRKLEPFKKSSKLIKVKSHNKQVTDDGIFMMKCILIKKNMDVVFFDF